MEKSTEPRHGRHCVFKMHVHLVFVTQYPREVFSKTTLDDLRTIFASVCADFEAELVEFSGSDDHVHLLVNDPPKVAVSALVNSLKGVSSRLIRREKYSEIRKKLWGRVLWSQSFLPEAVAALPSKSFANTSNSSKPLTECQNSRTDLPSALSFPGMNAEVCRATRSSTHQVRHGIINNMNINGFSRRRRLFSHQKQSPNQVPIK